MEVIRDVEAEEEAEAATQVMIIYRLRSERVYEESNQRNSKRLKQKKKERETADLKRVEGSKNLFLSDDCFF